MQSLLCTWLDIFMGILFTVCVALLVGLAGLHTYERSCGARMVSDVRVWLDHFSLSLIRSTRRSVKCTIEFVRQDIFLKSLHLLTRATLVVIRYTEHKLTKISLLLHPFRRARGQYSTMPSSALSQLARKEDEYEV